MNVRIMVAAIAAASVCLVGCGSETTTSTAESAGASTAPSDDQQIRDLLEKQRVAVQNYDLTALADLTCTQYREDARAKADKLQPPRLTEFGTATDAAKLDQTKIVAKFRKRFPKASDDTLNAAATALIAYDQTAFDTAFRKLLSESTTTHIDKVENITIDGDKATADVTLTSSVGGQEPTTKTDKVPFVREDGTWLTCDEPD